jgi:hypothetical protein
MGRTICFIDEDGIPAICGIECLDDEQIREIMGSLEIDCKKCPFYPEHKKFCELYCSDDQE